MLFLFLLLLSTEKLLGRPMCRNAKLGDVDRGWGTVLLRSVALRLGKHALVMEGIGLTEIDIVELGMIIVLLLIVSSCMAQSVMPTRFRLELLRPVLRDLLLELCLMVEPGFMIVLFLGVT